MDLSRCSRRARSRWSAPTTGPGSYADNVLRNLERSGFEGPVWGVNPKRADEVLGRAACRALAELPEPVDAVVVAIPAARRAGGRSARPARSAAAARW